LSQSLVRASGASHSASPQAQVKLPSARVFEGAPRNEALARCFFSEKRQFFGECEMSKTRTWVTLAATALATVFVASTSLQPAFARDGHSSGHSFGGSGGSKFSGGGGRSFSSGPKSFGGGTRSYSHTYRSPSGSSRVYAYRSHDGRRHGHHRHFRGFVGYPYVDGYYGYSDGCYWLRRRALATGSSYWWNRYYDCTNDY
jgi:hypothetical protein